MMLTMATVAFSCKNLYCGKKEKLKVVLRHLLLLNYETDIICCVYEFSDLNNFSSFPFTFAQTKKKQSCLYQELDRHRYLQCAMNITKFLRNYQSIVAQFGYGLSVE